VPYAAVATAAPATTEPVAPAASAAVQAPTDFATLVDSIARARDDNALATAAPVGVTMQHADFGPVSMQFTARDQGLAVTMRSADPGFAPAVAAAAASSSSNASDSQSDTSHGQNHANAPDPAVITTPGQTTTASHATTHSDQTARNDTARHNSGQTDTQTGNQPRSQPRRANPAATPQPRSDDTDDSAIFA